jgi:hypothetical protein
MIINPSLQRLSIVGGAHIFDTPAQAQCVQNSLFVINMAQNEGHGSNHKIAS